ncbi:hypothetical protein [Marivirga harenae]|uniref:hypothetical protein n=1 Tax=Marivirga harenae TaxID=2010992 RepID=UPI0026DF028E|nr:hypothetical protein [Marivirga harenae]WKV11545.1 hypothetical protein Q3Y49_15180 [Marivirga harenae]|tara:strand:+ start:30749 stop:31126 length:378 start_codon:yes stop_codon:yes gene_type:complete
MNLSRIIAFAVLLFIVACGKLPELKNIDLKNWKDDKDGCLEYRIEVISDLLDQKEELKGLSQNEVIDLLGAADKHQLYERSQKFFIYYLEPNENCAKYSEGYVKALYIRFNSLDQAVDFNVQEVK